MRSTDRADSYKHTYFGAPSASGYLAKLTAKRRPANMHPQGALSGGLKRDPYLSNPNRFSSICCPVPFHVDGTPVLSISASAASPYVRVCFVFGDLCFSIHDFCYYFPPSISAFPRVSCVLVAPPAGHRNAGLVFRALCRCFLLFFSFFLAFHLVLSCRPFVGRSPGHIIGLTVPANSNRVPSGLGLRTARMHIYIFNVFFPFFSFLPFLFAPFRPFLPFFV